MEIYAAMVDDLDRYLGKVLESLKKNGDFENTFIFFMSDNGPEGAPLEIGWDALGKWVEQCCDNRIGEYGRRQILISGMVQTGHGQGLAPFRMFKAFTTEGGIRAPAIVHYPEKYSRWCDTKGT